MNQTDNQSALLDYYGKPSFFQAFPLTVQHAVTVVVGCITPAIVVPGATGPDPTDRVFLTQVALVVAGLTTFLQLFPIGNKNGPRIGAVLPMIMGVSFIYVLSTQAIAGHESGPEVPMILNVRVIGSTVIIIIGFSTKKIRKLFPPSTAGTVVFITGLSLHPTVVNHMAGGTGKPLASEIGRLGFGSWQNWTTALITSAVVTVLDHYTKGTLEPVSIFIGVIVGYAAALGLGLVDFSGVASAGLFQLPASLYPGAVLDSSSCVAIDFLLTINSIQAIDDFSATITDSIDRISEDKELQGGIMGYDTPSIIGAVPGGFPTATYNQNVGIAAATRVINRIVLGMAVVILLVTSLIPKFSAVLTTIPQYVLGGVTVTIFISIVITGTKLVTTEDMNYRNISIVGFSAASGMDVTQAVNSLAAFPDWATTILGKSSVVVATCVAILLNVVPSRENAVAKRD